MARWTSLLALLIISGVVFATTGRDVASGVSSGVAAAKQGIANALPILGFILLVIGLVLLAGGAWALKASKQEGKGRYKIAGIIALGVGALMVLSGLLAFVIALIAPSLIDTFMGMGGGMP